MFVFLVFLKIQDHLRPGCYLFAAELHQKNYEKIILPEYSQ
jgi:hypothetical protein